jgi:hypothetical protein
VVRHGALVPGRPSADAARGEDGALVKNPAAQLMRDATAQLRALAIQLGFTPEVREGRHRHCPRGVGRSGSGPTAHAVSPDDTEEVIPIADDLSLTRALDAGTLALLGRFALSRRDYSVGQRSTSQAPAASATSCASTSGCRSGRR